MPVNEAKNEQRDYKRPGDSHITLSKGFFESWEQAAIYNRVNIETQHFKDDTEINDFITVMAEKNIDVIVVKTPKRGPA